MTFRGRYYPVNMAASWVMRRLCTAAAEAAAPVKTTRLQRLKNSKAAGWIKGLLSDYREACREVVVGAWERPVKASIYLGLLGGSWACMYTQPDDTSFETALLDCSNRLALLSPWIRSATSDGHVLNLVKLRNEGRLRHVSLGLVALTYRADYDEDANLYEARCSNVSVPWRELPQRVVDVGFVGRWWVLDFKMKDHDVNEEEFKNLPAHMQATSPPRVQEVERNERLHKASWLPLKAEEDEEEEKKEQTTSEEEEKEQTTSEEEKEQTTSEEEEKEQTTSEEEEEKEQTLAEGSGEEESGVEQDLVESEAQAQQA